MDKIKKYSKSIAGFWAALAVFAASVLALDIPFPNGVVAVLSVVAASGGIALVIAGAPANPPTTKQILKAAPALGLAVGTTVANATIDAVSDAVTSYINNQSQAFAQPSKSQVQDIAAVVPTVVAQVTEDVVADILSKFGDTVSAARK